MDIEDIVKQLPKDFVIGTSISSHQTEGGNDLNDWYLWETMGHAPAAGRAAGFWKNYREWVDKASLVGDAFRMSIEWSRVEPREGHFDYAVLGRYKRILRYCKSRGLATIVTLHHFTNPAWLVGKGEWTDHRTVKFFCRYVRACADYLGGLADYWVTINEPQVYAGVKVVGGWPGRHGLVEALSTGLVRMVKAHKKSYRIIKDSVPSALVGSAQSIQYFGGTTAVGKAVARLANRFWNFVFMGLTHREHDFIGLNYYGRIDFPLRYRTDCVKNIRPCARGLLVLMKAFQKRFGKPIMITENGMFSFKEDLQDGRRSRLIAGHLSAVARAIRLGIDVKGYLHWSLMDNYEWLSGHNVFMGLFTRDGRAKASAAFMKRIKTMRRRMGRQTRPVASDKRSLAGRPVLPP